MILPEFSVINSANSCQSNYTSGLYKKQEETADIHNEQPHILVLIELLAITVLLVSKLV